MKKVPTIIMSRVCGYYAAVRDMNIGKRREFADHKVYDVSEARKAVQHD